MAGFSPLESGSTAPKSNIAIDHKRVLPLNSSLRSQEYQALGDCIVFLCRMRSCEVHPLGYSRITCHRLTDLADQQIHFPRPWNRPKQTLPFNYALITLDFYSKMYPRHIYDFFRAVGCGAGVASHMFKLLMCRPPTHKSGGRVFERLLRNLPYSA